MGGSVGLLARRRSAGQQAFTSTPIENEALANHASSPIRPNVERATPQSPRTLKAVRRLPSSGSAAPLPPTGRKRPDGLQPLDDRQTRRAVGPLEAVRERRARAEDHVGDQFLSKADTWSPEPLTGLRDRVVFERQRPIGKENILSKTGGGLVWLQE